MSYKYCIESSAWVEYFSGSVIGEKIKDLIETEEIATSIIAVAELADKFERDARQFHQYLLFIQSRAAILPISIKITLTSAKLKKQFRKKHKKFGLADALHLATAQSAQAILITKDRGFSSAEDVMILE